MMLRMLLSRQMRPWHLMISLGEYVIFVTWRISITMYHAPVFARWVLLGGFDDTIDEVAVAKTGRC